MTGTIAMRLTNFGDYFAERDHTQPEGFQQAVASVLRARHPHGTRKAVRAYDRRITDAEARGLIEGRGSWSAWDKLARSRHGGPMLVMEVYRVFFAEQIHKYTQEELEKQNETWAAFDALTAGRRPPSDVLAGDNSRQAAALARFAAASRRKMGR